MGNIIEIEKDQFCCIHSGSLGMFVDFKSSGFTLSGGGECLEDSRCSIVLRSFDVHSVPIDMTVVG